MKHLFTFLSLILSTFCISQPTLTLDIVPSIGESFEATIGEGTVLFGEAGGNQQWDFSTLSTFENLPMHILSPANVEGSDKFPGADFVWHFDEVDIYEFYEVTDTAIIYLGVTKVLGESIVEIQQDLNDRLKLPLSVDDEYSYTTVSKATISGVTFGEAESFVSILPTAWGDIKTPYGLYEDVLRVSKLEILDDVAEYKVSWYHTGSFIPVMVYTFGDDPDFIDTYLFVNHPSLVSSAENLSAANSISATYLGGEFRVHHELDEPIFQIFDSSGKIIPHTSRTIIGQSTLNLNSPIADGICFIIAQSADGKVATEKVMVQN